MAGAQPLTTPARALRAHQRGSGEQTRPRLAGVFTDLVTPFRGDAVDEAAFVALIERQIAAGAQGVIVASGAAGERSTLRDGDVSRLIALAVQAAAGRAAVIADAGANATATAIARAREARDLGADAVLVAPPWYNRPSPEGVVSHYRAIALADTLRILVWDCPARTSLSLSLLTLERLAELPGMAGVVDATGEISRVSALRRIRPDWALLSGQDASRLSHLAQGADGCVSLAANVRPDVVCAIEAASALQDWRGARRMHDHLAELDALLALDPIPSAAKLALSLQGHCRPDVRLPITPCQDAVRERLKGAMGSAPAALS
jgi:4-hydroxy-tetrahydrodipicolinate synthase